MHQDDGAVAEVFVISDGVDDGVAAVVFPVERVGVGYSFRWKRNVEKRDTGGVLRDKSQMRLNKGIVLEIISVDGRKEL